MCDESFFIEANGGWLKVRIAGDQLMIYEGEGQLGPWTLREVRARSCATSTEQMWSEVERLRAENERLRAELQAIVYTPLDPHHQDDPTAFYRASAQDAVKKAARALKGERR